MSDLREMVARALADSEWGDGIWDGPTLSGNEKTAYRGLADAAIAVSRPVHRADALEEAARCAEQNAAETWTDPNATDTRGIMRLQAEDIAAAIRALAGQP